MARGIGHVLVKALLLPLVLLGVLAMHQLPMPHGTELPVPASSAAAGAPAIPTSEGDRAHHDSADRHGPEEHSACCDSAPGTAMLHMCLAVLVMGIVLAATRGGWWRSPPPATVGRSHLPLRHGGARRGLPWTRPTIHSLRVLRL